MGSGGNKIRVLEGLKPVQARPEMYIGSAVNPQQLIVEVLDNALDELNNKFASEVHLNIYSDGSVVVKDNGRGIPIHEVELENGSKVDSIIAAATILHSGAKFDNVSYNVRIGMHGVGLSVVNALSEYMHIEIANGDKVHIYTFIKTELTEQETRDKVPEDVSTLVSFKPDIKYFTSLNYNTQVMHNRLRLIAAHIENAKIYLNNDQIEHIPMESLVRYYLDIDEGLNLFKISHIDGFEKVVTYLTFDDTKMIKGDVNLNICAGKYLSTFTTVFANAMLAKYPSLTKSNVLNGLKAYISMSVKDPRFAGQVKHEMVADVTHIIKPIAAQISALSSIPFFADHFKAIIDAKSMQTASKKLRRKAIVDADNPLADCTNLPGDILYILEGDSAAGTIKQFRNIDVEAIFPLSGKILNTVDKSIDEALDSKKVKFLLEAIGVDPSGKQKDFRYKEFKVVTDADSDGAHIAVLVTLAVWKYAPDLIKQKRFKIILPPLYGFDSPAGFVPIYSEQELESYRAKNYDIRRFKGLGEMNPSQLEAVFRGNCKEYTVCEPENDKIEQAIISCITDTQFKRKVCNNYEKFGLPSLMDAIQ